MVKIYYLSTKLVLPVLYIHSSLPSRLDYITHRLQFRLYFSMFLLTHVVNGCIVVIDQYGQWQN